VRIRIPAALAAALGAFAAAGGPDGGGLRVYHIGNSHTDSLRNTLMPLAVAAGHSNHFFSTSIILGAPLRWIRDHDKDCRERPWSEGLAPANAWDAATLQCYASDEDDIAAAVHFAGLLLRGNPKCRILIYTIWPGADDDWEAPKHERTEARSELYAAAIAKAFPDAPAPRVAPTSLVMRELGRLADAGELPGVPSRFALLSDGGHLAAAGHYAVSAAFCSMLYNEPPFAYPGRILAYARESKTEKRVSPDRVQFELPSETASVIRRVVWDVLATYPPAGVDAGLVIADRALPAAIAGRPYAHAFRALHASGPAAWSLAGGTLPAGLALGVDGALSGTPAAPGSFAFTIRVEAGGRRFEKPFTLVASGDRPPRIAPADPGAVPLDRPVFHELRADGGVGKLAWSLASADARLPYGVRLAKTGILLGTPGEAGEFRFAVRVTDAHPDGPRSDERSFVWRIDPATPAALVVPVVKAAPVLDGNLDEPFWRLDQAVTGAPPAKAASFGAVWVPNRDWRKGGTVYIGVKVGDGAAGRGPGDAVHLYLDGMHNRETMYNQDDTHFVIRRDGKTESVRGKPNWFLKAAAREADGGWTLEIAVPHNYFVGAGAWIDMAPRAVYGFDLAVGSGAGGSARSYWRGSAANDEDTSGFGSLVLGGEGKQ